MRRVVTSMSPGRAASAWGVVLGLWIALGDIALTPAVDADVTYVGVRQFFFMASGAAIVVVIAAAGFLGFAGRGTTIAMAVAVVATGLALVAAAAIVPYVYNSWDMPAARFMVLPAIAVGLGSLGTALWVRGRRGHAEVVLLAALTAATLVAFVHEAPLWWATAIAVAGTYLWLWPSVTPWARTAGMALHGLALFGFLATKPDWFTWTPFPFLTFAPVYIVAQFLRTQEAPRRAAWWTGAVLSAGTFLLGCSTLIGNLRRGASVIDSLIMLAGGLAFGALFYWFWRGARDVTPPLPATPG